MGMPGGVPGPRLLALEAPNMVTQVRSHEYACFREVDKIAVDGGSVVPLVGEGLANLSVTERGIGFAQVREHRDARTGATHSVPANLGLQVGHRRRFCR